MKKFKLKRLWKKNKYKIIIIILLIILIATAIIVYLYRKKDDNQQQKNIKKSQDLSQSELAEVKSQDSSQSEITEENENENELQQDLVDKAKADADKAKADADKAKADAEEVHTNCTSDIITDYNNNHTDQLKPVTTEECNNFLMLYTNWKKEQEEATLEEVARAREQLRAAQEAQEEEKRKKKDCNSNTNEDLCTNTDKWFGIKSDATECDGDKCTSQYCCIPIKKCGDTVCDTNFVNINDNEHCTNNVWSKIQCCEPRQCKTTDCENNYILKDDSICTNGDCGEENCCELRQCKSTDCTNDQQEVKPDTQCNNSECSECCKNKSARICSTDFNDCGPGKILINGNPVCADTNKCDKDECCEELKCDSVTCNANYIKINNDSVCGTNCNNATCCKLKQCETNDCPANYTLINNTQCTDDNCSKEKCCTPDPKPTCSTFKGCDSASTIREINKECTDYTCTKKECCDKKVCDKDFQCPKDSKSTTNECGSNCTEPKCCQKTCQSFDCSEKNRKNKENMDIICENNYCKKDVCCDIITRNCDYNNFECPKDSKPSTNSSFEDTSRTIETREIIQENICCMNKSDQDKCEDQGNLWYSNKCMTQTQKNCISNNNEWKDDKCYKKCPITCSSGKKRNNKQYYISSNNECCEDKSPQDNCKDQGNVWHDNECMTQNQKNCTISNSTNEWKDDKCYKECPATCSGNKKRNNKKYYISSNNECCEDKSPQDNCKDQGNLWFDNECMTQEQKNCISNNNEWKDDKCYKECPATCSGNKKRNNKKYYISSNNECCEDKSPQDNCKDQGNLWFDNECMTQEQKNCISNNNEWKDDKCYKKCPITCSSGKKRNNKQYYISSNNECCEDKSPQDNCKDQGNLWFDNECMTQEQKNCISNNNEWKNDKCYKKCPTTCSSGKKRNNKQYYISSNNECCEDQTDQEKCSPPNIWNNDKNICITKAEIDECISSDGFVWDTRKLSCYYTCDNTELKEMGCKSDNIPDPGDINKKINNDNLKFEKLSTQKIWYDSFCCEKPSKLCEKKGSAYIYWNDSCITRKEKCEKTCTDGTCNSENTCIKDSVPDGECEDNQIRYNERCITLTGKTCDKFFSTLEENEAGLKGLNNSDICEEIEDDPKAFATKTAASWFTPPAECGGNICTLKQCCSNVIKCKEVRSELPDLCKNGWKSGGSTINDRYGHRYGKNFKERKLSMKSCCL